MSDIRRAAYPIPYTTLFRSFKIGEKVRFTMVVTATAGTPKNVMLTDTLPTLGKITSWVIRTGGTPSGTCATTACTALKCSFGDLPPASTRTVTVESTAAAYV